MVFGFAAVSAARVGCVVHGFGAPLALYGRLSRAELSGPAGNATVCVGKEWYRFASSFFLPTAATRLRFVKSGFDGLLPQVSGAEAVGRRRSRRRTGRGRFRST